MMSRLTRDGTAEPVSRDQKISGANGDREILFFPVQLTTTNMIVFALISSLLYVMTIHNLAVNGGAKNFVWNSSLDGFIFYYIQQYLVSENLRT